MMTEKMEQRVLEYLEGDLSPGEEKAFLGEAASNPELAALLGEYRGQDRALSTWFAAQSARAGERAVPDLGALPGAIAASGRARSAPNRRIIYAIAAALVAGAFTWGAIQYTRGGASPIVGTVLAADGRPQALEGTKLRALASAGEIRSTDELLKTPSDSYMEVATVSGDSRFEMNQNSAVRLVKAGGSSQINVERGEVLVRAVAGRDLLVTTPQFDVRSDSGVFSVARGVRGAEVAVVSGAVEIRQAGTRRQLRAGESFSSTGSTPVSISRRVVWSRHADEYAGLMPPVQVDAPVAVADEVPVAQPAVGTAASAALGEAAPATAPAERRAHTTAFLPAGTLSIIEFPSIKKLLGSTEFHDLSEVFLGEEKLALAESSTQNLPLTAGERDVFLARVREVLTNEDLELFLSSLGGSISLGIGTRGPVLIAEITENQAALSALIGSKVDPWLATLEADERKRPQVGIANGMLVLATNADDFEESSLAAGSWLPTEFGKSRFLADVRAMTTGSTFTAALDAQALVRRASENSHASRFFDRLGLGNMLSLVAATDFADQADNQALRVTFDGDRQGVMGWLGAPGPLSAFQFFSPDAHAVMTMRVQRPALVLGEVVGWISQDNGGHGLPTDSPEFQLVERVAASLGNEVAIGLDNPVLPLPNVKVAIEVLDPVGFHDGMIDLLDLLWSNGSETNQVTVASNAYRNHLIVEFLHPSMPISIAYAVVGDFIVLGPGRPFLESTIDIFADKVGLDQEASFQNALPAKSGSYCSAIFYAGNGEGTSSLAPYLSEYLRSRNIPVDLSTVGVAGGTGHGGVYYAIANNGRIDFFIEGVKGDYEMGGMIPAVAQWIVQPR